jgi:phosphate-selective porin OprO/OprP
VRRARLSASGTLAHDFRYKLENDFAGNASALTDVYLTYEGFDPVAVTVGQFKEPFGLEVLTSDLFTTFSERASIFAFAPDRNIGVSIFTHGNTPIGAYTAAIGGFGSGTGVASTDDESRDLTGRLTIAPIAEKDKALHFGVAGNYRIPDSATDTYRVASRAENRLSSLQAVDTGSIANVSHTNLLGLEAAGVWGPASVQGEYMLANIRREFGFRDATLDGYYVEASYFLTGESRNYAPAQGRFERVKPNHPFSLHGDGWGAWQAAARWSNLDLNDGPISGGEMNDLTLALRWLPTAHTLVSLNYIKANTDANAVTPNDDPSVWLLRTQLDF